MIPSPDGRRDHAGTRPSRRLVGTLPAATAAVLLLALPGCGGSSPTQTVVPPPPPPPPDAVSFQSASPFAAPNSMRLGMEEFSEESDEVVLILEATVVEDLYGYGVDLVYDTEFLELSGIQGGRFLRGDDITVELRTREEPPGRLIVGHTRVGDVDGASGSGIVLRLTFEMLQTGDTELAFENEDAFDSDGDRTRSAFVGGTLTIREL